MDSPLVRVVDFVAGLLITESDLGIEHAGPPEAFRSITKESGTDLLLRILVPPDMAALKHGAIREALASVQSVALHGFEETRAWDGASDYIVDTGEGSCAVLRFAPPGCVAAMIHYDPWRELDLAEAVRAVPEALRPTADEVCRLPFLNSEHQLSVSSIFWSHGGQLCAPEPWPTAYGFGAEIFRREMAPDVRWKIEAEHYYGADAALLDLIVRITPRRALSGRGWALSEGDIHLLAPPYAPHRTEALRLLIELGFETTACSCRGA